MENVTDIQKGTAQEVPVQEQPNQVITKVGNTEIIQDRKAIIIKL